MDIPEIKKIIRLMEENGLVEFEREDEKGRIRLTRALSAAGQTPQSPIPPTSSSQDLSPPGGKDIISPMVGTFYRAPSVESGPFVDVGERVCADTVVCVIEAMKVMNEVTADLEGEIVEVLVEDGAAVEFAQPLFRLRTTVCSEESL